MMGRVTIACGVGCHKPAVEMHSVFTEHGRKRVFDYPCCAGCLGRSEQLDQRRRENVDASAAFSYAKLYNPALLTPEEDCEVEIAMNVLCRLWRAATSNTFEAAADRALLRAAGEAALGTRYQRCRRLNTMGCSHCNGTGWVLVRREAA